MKLYGKCRTCGGTGRVTREGLIFSEKVPCPRCQDRGLSRRG